MSQAEAWDMSSLGKVFLQQVSLAVQGLNGGGLSLTCFPSCSWYKVARLGTTPLAWGRARVGWFVPQLFSLLKKNILS